MNNATVIGSFAIDTKMKTDGLSEGLNDVKEKSKGIGGTLQVALGNLMSDLTTMAVSGLKQIAQAGVQYNAEIEKYQTALTTLTGSADKANEIIDQIKKDAASTPFDVSGLVQANQLLISAGVSSDSAREDILALGNAISATGGGNEELSRMAVNLQQIKNVGKASSLDIKQFAYAGIDVYGLLADSMGITREEASDLDITYEDLTKALKDAAGEGGKYAGAMEAQSKTFNGQVSNLKDNLDQFIGDAMNPLFTLLRDEVLPIINQIIQGEGNIDELIPALTEKIIAFIGETLTKMIEALPQILEIGIQVIVALINGITQQMPTLIPVIVDTIILLVNTLIDNLPMIINAGIDLLLALVEGIIEALPQMVEALPEVIEKLVSALTDPAMIVKILSAGVQLLQALVSGFITATPKLISEVIKLPKKIADNMLSKIKETDWKTLGINMLDGILEGLTKFGSKIKEAAKKIYNEVKKKITDFFGIGSPSKKMRDEVGRWIPAGVAVGIETNTDSIDDAIDEMNNEMMDKMTQAVNLETGKMAYSGTNGTVSQMLSAFGTTTVVNENKLLLDGDEIYANQQVVSAKKNLQTQFGGGYSVSS